MEQQWTATTTGLKTRASWAQMCCFFLHFLYILTNSILYSTCMYRTTMTEMGHDDDDHSDHLCDASWTWHGASTTQPLPPPLPPRRHVNMCRLSFYPTTPALPPPVTTTSTHHKRGTRPEWQQWNTRLETQVSFFYSSFIKLLKLFTCRLLVLPPPTPCHPTTTTTTNTVSPYDNNNNQQRGIGGERQGVAAGDEGGVWDTSQSPGTMF